MLLDANLDLCLCDFGGSKNPQYDGEGLPDYGFFDPRDKGIDVTEDTEIFGLGSSLYNFMTGHLPHGPSEITTVPEAVQYMHDFTRLLTEAQFPDVSTIVGGNIIMGCWNKTFRTVKEVYECYLGMEGKAACGSGLDY